MSRGSGKTTSLIYESNKTDAVIVTFNSMSANLIKKKAQEMNVEIKQPITFSELIYDHKGKRDKYLIDELDACLTQLDVVGYTNSDSKY